MRNALLIPLILTALSLMAASGCGSAPGSNSTSPDARQTVRTGAEMLLDERLGELEDLRVGLLMNPTSRVDGVHMLDTLLARGVNVTALFAAEHGFRGEGEAGETIENGIDQATGLPVYSLYGQTRTPTPEMMEEVDVVLADLPDVGARFYTYSSTVGNVLEAAAGAGVSVWVLDRPNPAGGEYVAGWVVEDRFRSFVGRYPVPMIHGMTMGELARMMVGEGWISADREPDLQVVEMEGWSRDMLWPETGLEWIAPSPNLPAFDNAYLYLGTVLFEGTNLSEGRDTEQPFLLIGSPATDNSYERIVELDERHAGVGMEPEGYQPCTKAAGRHGQIDYDGRRCYGVLLTLEDPSAVDPLVLGTDLLRFLLEHTEGGAVNAYMQNLTGIPNDSLRAWLQREDISATWEDEVRAFRELRRPYLLYE
ncbi:MAG: DUF1343 domain-containing protein [Balneolaceae bacterium]|nr:DUF1343 domain-containing protein [Balneolaceae bacterium]